MGKLNVVPYDFDRNEEVISLLNRVFNPWIGDEEYFNWKYRKTDVCNFPIAWIIEKNGKIVAFNGYRPRMLMSGGNKFWIVQSFDTATDPDCRGEGLFGILQNSVYEEMRRHKISWVYGWTSEIGFKVFTKKAGWKIWGNQRYLMKVLNVKKFVEQKVRNPFLRLVPYAALSIFGRLAKPGIVSGVEIKEEEIFPESFDKTCKQVCYTFGMIALRDISYIRWKLFNPCIPYKLLCAYYNGNSCGYAIIAQRDNCLDIDDLLAESSDILYSLLSKIEDIARKSEKEMIRFRVNEKHPWANLFKKSGYFWSNTSFKMLGKKLAEDTMLSFDVKNLHWTFFDKNE